MSSIYAGRGMWSAEDPTGIASRVDLQAAESLEIRRERARELLCTTELSVLTVAAMTALSLDTVNAIARTVVR